MIPQRMPNQTCLHTFILEVFALKESFWKPKNTKQVLQVFFFHSYLFSGIYLFYFLESYESFLEELVVRKELADNFCYYNNNYDNFDGFAQWAKDSLTLHQSDKRDHLYTFDQLEKVYIYTISLSFQLLIIVNKRARHTIDCGMQHKPRWSTLARCMAL